MELRVACIANQERLEGALEEAASSDSTALPAATVLPARLATANTMSERKDASR